MIPPSILSTLYAGLDALEDRCIGKEGDDLVPARRWLWREAERLPPALPPGFELGACRRVLEEIRIRLESRPLQTRPHLDKVTTLAGELAVLLVLARIGLAATQEPTT